MQQHSKVIITDFIHDGLIPERKALDGIAEVLALNVQGEAALQGRIEDAAAIMIYHTTSLSRQTLERLRQCRLIVRCGAGFDNVDHEFAAQRGIPVANVPDYGTEEVADSAIGLMLSLTRGISFLNSRLRSGVGEWTYTPVAPLRRLRGQVFGVVGLGRIGTAAALRARAFGLDVCFFDPYKADGNDKALGLRRAESLEELLAQADVLSLHCPLSPESRAMINDRTLALMKRSSILLNTARGGLVDTTAVLSAIESGQLSGAGIDVLPMEPPPSGDPLITAWRNPDHVAHHRVIINPHSAFYSEEGLMDMRIKGAEACRRALLGLPLRNVVNQPASVR